MTTKTMPSCSFCGLRQDQVAKLIAGPHVYICNVCTDLCSDILTEERIPRDVRWCAARCPQGQRCELTEGHSGAHENTAHDAVPAAIWRNTKEPPVMVMNEKSPAEPAPTVSDLVAFLRERCADPQHTYDGDGDEIGVRKTVLLPIDLVLEIANGIEATTRPAPDAFWTTAEASAIVALAAKDIAKLIVTRLFEPAKAEAESAVAAAKRLGFDAEQIATIMDPTRMSAWSTAMKVGLAASVLPMLLGVMGLGRKGGLGA